MGTLRKVASRGRSRLLATLSGDADGSPHWVKYIALGSDEGYFGPGSAAWAVHGGMPTMVAGIRALLMQTLHPGAMAGVHDHSRYKVDPLGRLAGTIQWLITVTFGDRALAERESERVRKIHEHVRGHYESTSGQLPYAATDPDLLLWVHLVFTDAFLGSHRLWGDPIPGGEDAYVKEWAIAGRLVGVANPPETVAELESSLRSFAERGILRREERVDETVGFLRNPPLSRGMRPAYRVMFAGAVASLPDDYREMLGLKAPRWPAIAMTGGILAFLRWMLGPSSTSERAALERLERIKAEAVTPLVENDYH